MCSIYSNVCSPFLCVLIKKQWFCCWFASLTLFVDAASPVRNIQVTLRGKKFDVDEAVTVKDVMEKVSDGNSGGRLLFGGKQLSPEDTLEDAGVQEGDSLQIVPTSKSSSTKKKKKKKAETTAAAAATTPSSTESTTTTPAGTGAPADFDLSEMMKAMGGDGKMPDMNESMEMMSNMMNSPMLQEYLNDPEKLEASRQMILQNPMMKQMFASMPGMREIIEDPVAWKETMSAAVNLYKNMDPNDLKSLMEGSMPPGMSDLAAAAGLDPSMAATPSALDELSEDDD